MRILKLIGFFALVLLKGSIISANQIFIDPFTIFIDQKNQLGLFKQNLKFSAYAIEDSVSIIYQENFYNLVLLNEPLCDEEKIVDRNQVLPSDLTAQVNYTLLSHALGVMITPKDDFRILSKYECENKIEELEKENQRLAKHIENHENLLVKENRKIRDYMKELLNKHANINGSNVKNINNDSYLELRKIFGCFINDLEIDRCLAKSIKKIRNENFNYRFNAR